VHGLCSNYLADVKPGDELIMTGPAGTALLLADNPWNKRIVCVSTGGQAHVLADASAVVSAGS
jgi:ferredoxin-NADP reductase